MMVSHHCRSVPQSTQPGPCWRTPGFSSPSSATYEQCWDDCYAKSLQSCPTLCDPMDSSPPGSPVPGILQARTLEWVAISFSNAWKWKVKMKVKSLSRVPLLATPWTAACQDPLSMGFSRQEYWSGVPLPEMVGVGILTFFLILRGKRCLSLASTLAIGFSLMFFIRMKKFPPIPESFLRDGWWISSNAFTTSI